MLLNYSMYSVYVSELGACYICILIHSVNALEYVHLSDLENHLELRDFYFFFNENICSPCAIPKAIKSFNKTMQPLGVFSGI